VATLPHEAKTRLITLLAQFSGPAEAARTVSKEFGVTLTRAQAWKYDPTRRGCKISSRLRELFHVVRDQYLSEVQRIGIAHSSHRLRVLDRLVPKLIERGDYNGAIRALEQAAKEVGGYYLRERNGRHGATPANLVAPAITEDIETQRAELCLRLQAQLSRLSGVA
jgi:hypothetical protein